MDLNYETKSFLFSFVELLNDTNNYYLTSLRGIVKRQDPNDVTNLNKEIYFVGSFLDVNDKMINNSYKKIYAPKRWFNYNVKNINEKDIVPESWFKV